MNFVDYENTLPYSITDHVVRDAFNTEQHRIINQFYKDVKADLDITDNPKANMLMVKAWTSGHSSGYEEVYNHAVDLVDLIK